jgi:hypothetical protein
VLIGLIYGYLTWQRTVRFKPGVAFLILMTLVIFDKNPNPQYLYWFFSLFPLVVWTDKRRWIVIYLLILAVFATTQLVYPLHYSDLLYRFFADGSQSRWFDILVLRDGLMVALFGVAASSILASPVIKAKGS